MATITVTQGYNAPTGFSSGETVTPAKLNSAQNPTVSISAIVNADIDANAAIANSKLSGVLPINTQTDNYTLVLADAGKVIDVNAATDKTVTIPANSSVAFATGASILVTRRGAGELTIAGATGVDVRAAQSSFSTVTGAASTDIITATGSAFIAGQIVRFSSITGGAGLSASTDYYVDSPSTNTFKLAATSGGTAINFTTDITAGVLVANHKRVGQQNGAVALIKLGTNEWLVVGNLKA